MSSQLTYPHLTARQNESHAEALERMAINARNRHIGIVSRDCLGCWHVSSGSGQVPYRVSSDGQRCECQGYARNGLCSHVAVVRRHLQETTESNDVAVVIDLVNDDVSSGLEVA